MDNFRKNVMSELKSYSVSIVWTKHLSTGGLNIGNSHQTDVIANSKEEAFGISYDKNKHNYKEHQVHLKSVLEQTEYEN